MDTIRNYVDALFASLPQTAENQNMKQEMLENLDEKFQGMLQDGATQEEAVGRVIASIGSVEELRRELGIKDVPAQEVQDDAPVVSEALMAEYRAYKSQETVWKAIGVMCFILCSPVYLVFDNLFHNQTLGIVAFFVLIAVGVACCMYSGRHNDYYQNLLGIHDEKDKKRGKGRHSTLFAGVTFPISVVIYLVLGFAFGWWHPGWIIFVACGVLTGAIEVYEEYKEANR